MGDDAGHPRKEGHKRIDYKVEKLFELIIKLWNIHVYPPEYIVKTYCCRTLYSSLF